MPGRSQFWGFGSTVSLGRAFAIMVAASTLAGCQVQAPADGVQPNSESPAPAAAAAVPVDLGALCAPYRTPTGLMSNLATMAANTTPGAIQTAAAGGNPSLAATAIAAVTPLATPPHASLGVLGAYIPIVYQRLHPGWLVYAYCEAGEEIRAGVRYDTGDLRAVRSFIAANHAFGPQFPNGMVPATVVFRASLPVDELTNLVQAGGLEVGGFEASGVRSDGTKFPLGGPVLPGGDPVPQRMIDMQLTLRGEPPGSVVEGVLLVRAKLDRAAFARLVADPRVLVVDVSSHFAQLEVARHFGVDQAKLKGVRGGPESFLHVASRHGLIPSDAPVGLPGGMIGNVGGSPPIATALASQPGPGGAVRPPVAVPAGSPTGQLLSPSAATAIANLPRGVPPGMLQPPATPTATPLSGP